MLSPLIRGTPIFGAGLFDQHGPNTGKNLTLQQVAVGHRQTVAMLVPKIGAFRNPPSRLRLYRSDQNLLVAVSDNPGQSVAGDETWQFYVFGPDVHRDRSWWRTPKKREKKHAL